MGKLNQDDEGFTVIAAMLFQVLALARQDGSGMGVMQYDMLLSNITIADMSSVQNPGLQQFIIIIIIHNKNNS